ncbi:MAG: DUF3320 domain-containing protein [Alphaproteobacteria bacterium]|nr:DUF3320 domain-containing protein [Alphaproteobacteria bacterium]
MDEHQEPVETAAAPGPTVSLHCAAASHLSVAFQQNAVPVIHEIRIDNPTDRDLGEIVLTIGAEPAFAPVKTIRIDQIGAGSSHHIRVPDVPLDAAFLRRLTEGLEGELRLLLTSSGSDIASTVVKLRLLPPSQWGGLLSAPELTAAFVRPNDPAIDTVLHDAGSRLATAGRSSAIDGYSSGKRERVWELASAIWSSLAAQAIVYVLPPASFERSGQKVRSPGDILERKTGTCFDLTLLFAACLEQAGLNPLVVLTQGHAFVGLWLKKEEFPSVAVDDVQVLRKRRDLDELIFIETTLLTSNQPPRFAATVASGAAQLDEGATAALEVAIDIRRARMMQIRPLDLGDGAAGRVEAGAGRAVADVGLDVAPDFGEDGSAPADEGQAVDRLERWKRRLLDLSLRNKLLNFKDTTKAIGLECPDPARLEDMLSDGIDFKLLPRSAMLVEGDQRDAQLFQDRMHDDGRRLFVMGAMEKKELHTLSPPADLERRLTELYRLSRTAFEEGGANILFLALGFLKWTQKDGSATVHRAPLLLIPVALDRKSVRAGFRMRLHEDDARFNPTLLQMLRQDFELRLPGLEGDLPLDKSGLDVARIWRSVREAVVDMKGWEVTTDVVLSTFSFTKFLIWKDLVDRVDVLKKNPVVRHLIDTPKHSYGDDMSFPAPEEIDAVHPRDVFAPLSSDSSQLSAVLAAGQGTDFVLFGPPGTGKSQTIANMIAHGLALGKTVLFVAQKTAALEVVQRRLRDIGLGEYCLEVHSTKAQKSQVLGQLKAAWHERAKPSADDWQDATGELSSLRDELNALVSALHRRRPNGIRAYEGFGQVVAARGRFADLRFDWAHHDHPEAERLALRRLCRDMSTMLKTIGDPVHHPLRGLGPAEWSPLWQREFAAAIAAAVDSMAPLRDAGSALTTALGLPSKSDRAAMAALARLCAVIGTPGAEAALALLDADLDAMDQALIALAALQQRAAKAQTGMQGSYRPSVFGQDLRALLAEWSAASATNFLFRAGRLRKVRLALQPFAVTPPPEEVSCDLVRLIEIGEIAREGETLAPILRPLGAAAAGLETDITRCAELIAGSRALRETLGEAVKALGTPTPDLIARLGGDDVRTAGNRFGDAWQAANAALSKVTHLAVADPTDGPAGEDWLESSRVRMQRWAGALNRSQAWCQWAALSAQANAKGLQALTGAVEIGLVPPAEMELGFDIAYARGWTDDIVTHDPILRSFLPVRHEATIERFRKADDRVRELTKRIVRARLAGGVPAPSAFGSDAEWGALSREIAKKSRHLPLRQLFGQIPGALTRLTPCVMMSPLSIAQFLPPGSKPFDLVIFDEASQIPVWDAIGAIARGRQVVIVGDPEQLPPTSVGERGVDDVEDGTDVEDQESILDECLASNIRPLRLDWHYRSRYESLIAFSNREYYKGRLVTFPSPVTSDRAVHYVHVPDGVYERGKGRVNRAEAAAVVDEVVRRLQDPAFTVKRQSLGIVTFNGEQQRLIENLLDQARAANPEIEKFFYGDQWHEPVIVRNLENVQGDERDIIFFSVAVAQTDSARPVRTISSLQNAGGHRRLNVAITRARQEMAVFATLRADQIASDSSRGVQDFKRFLEFAERGPAAIAEAFAPTGGGTESPFEDAVKHMLETRGWQVHTQIGVSGFRIDLGIVDPDAPGRYLAGIECDGASYHRSATARDRDRLREAVLTQLGWRIRRVWSTDWWMDADAAFDRLQTQLEDDLAASRAAEAVTEEIEIPVDEPSPSSPAESTISGAEADDGDAPETEVLENDGQSVQQPLYARTVSSGADAPVAPVQYMQADLAAAGFAPDAKLFYDVSYRSELRRMVSHVIDLEGPIFEDVLVSRIARAHGFQRAAGRIRELVIGAAGERHQRSSEDDRAVLWPADADVVERVPYRASVNRDHGDIPLAELAGLAALHAQAGVSLDEVTRLMARDLGLAKLREQARNRLESVARRVLTG